MAVPQRRAREQAASAHAADDAQERTATGIYGIIVSGSVMAAAHAPTAVITVAAVLTTLLIYWTAERYARIVAERIHQGHRPSWRAVRAQVTSGWELVTTSFIPLGVLVTVRLLGVSLRWSIIWALISSTALLCRAGWRVGRGGGLGPFERLITTAVAGVFGVGMIVLKTLLH
jgi:hypothetical protein